MEVRECVHSIIRQSDATFADNYNQLFEDTSEVAAIRNTLGVLNAKTGRNTPKLKEETHMTAATATLVKNFGVRHNDAWCPRFAVIMIRPGRESIWLFETRTEAMRYFERTRKIHGMYLRPLEEGAAVDELYHACHAYNDYGDDYAEIFVTMISEV